MEGIEQEMKPFPICCNLRFEQIEKEEKICSNGSQDRTSSSRIVSMARIIIFETFIFSSFAAADERRVRERVRNKLGFEMSRN